MTPFLLAVAIGCQDYQVTKQVPELLVSPELSDLGAVPVGYSQEVVLRLDNLEGGDIEVRSVELTNLEGDFFIAATDISLVVPEGGTEYVTLEYAPEDIGYHTAIALSLIHI